MFNKDVILGFIRHALTFAGGYVTSQGWLDGEAATSAVGAIVTLVGVIWSALQKKKPA